jgi:para-aminobenzoate synthetase/4-amino-4-deoxychorismate lyase
MQLELPDPAVGVFETLLVRDGRVQAPEAHLERLDRSVRELYEFELPADLLASVVERARALSPPHRLRVDAIPDGGSELRVEFQVTPVSSGPPSPVICTPAVLPGGLGSHKWRDRRLVESLAGSGRVPLLVDDDGDVLEAAWANVWLVEQGRLITPPDDGRILPGVTRALLLALGPLHGLAVGVERCSISRAESAGHIFLTSSVRHAVAATLQSPSGGSSAPSPLAAIRELLGRSSWA